MTRIETQAGPQKELAKQVLSWITCAKRPLTISELQHALAIEVGDSSLDMENIPSIQDIVSVTAGLVAVDQESNILRLVHYTAQQYFERTRNRWFPTAERDIATACVTYLSFDVFESGFCKTIEELMARLRRNPFYSYVAHNWGHHARNATTLPQKVMDFLDCETKREASIQSLMSVNMLWHSAFTHGGIFLNFDHTQIVPRQMTALHLAAYFGLTEAIRVLIIRGHPLDAHDRYRRTPLSLAAEQGHVTVVKQLLETGKIEPNLRDAEGRTPLSWAASSGHVEVVRQLMAADEEVNLNCKDSIQDWTPLVAAVMIWVSSAFHLLLMMAQLLQLLNTAIRLLSLPSTLDPDEIDQSFQDLSRWSQLSRFTAVIKPPVARLFIAIAYKMQLFATVPFWLTVVLPIRLIGGRDASGAWTPLSWAASHGHEAVVRLLLATDGVDPICRDYKGQTPLALAAKGGHDTVIKLLLAKNSVDPDSKDSYGRTPLMHAAARGHETAIKLLLARNEVHTNSKSDGWTPFWMAAKIWCKPVLRQQLWLEPSKLLVRLFKQLPKRYKLLLFSTGILLLLSSNKEIATGRKDSDSGVTPSLFRMVLQFSVNTADTLWLLLRLISWLPYLFFLWTCFHEFSTFLCSEKNWRKWTFRGLRTLRTAIKSSRLQLIPQALVLGLVAVDKACLQSLDSVQQKKELILCFLTACFVIANHHGLRGIRRMRGQYVGDCDGRTSLSYAAAHGSEKAMKLLLAEHETDPEDKDSNGRTPLSYAAEDGREMATKLLLDDHRVDPDSKDCDGRTPLSRAAQGCHEAVVKLLLARKADPKSEDIHGKTPQWWATDSLTRTRWRNSDSQAAVLELLSSAN